MHLTLRTNKMNTVYYIGNGVEGRGRGLLEDSTFGTSWTDSKNSMQILIQMSLSPNLDLNSEISEY
jgi:hypothetical protein